jgi:hypothetical protein
LFSPEATCFSSGRKNGFVSGALRMVIPCDRSSRWTSYGRSRRHGIRRAYKTTRDVRSLTRCAPFSRTLGWQATFGIPSPIVSLNRFAPFRALRVLVAPVALRVGGSAFFAFANLKYLYLSPPSGSSLSTTPIKAIIFMSPESLCATILFRKDH